ncbi:MAG: DUF1471 domain-containing protein [Enterobacteriaceae bacterium]|nr:DUF1471 domain-containing protein [Enterobacteriaceae bacterium]
MKLAAIFSATAVCLALSIGSASAITEVINSDQATKMNLQSMGTISTTVRSDTLDGAMKAIEEKAEKQGAQYFRVIGAMDLEDSPYWRISAEIYK